MKMLRVGIAGYGVVGKRRHQFIDLHPNMRTVAVCDMTFAGSGFFKDGVKYHSSIDELLKNELDVLFVCLTNDVAAAATIAGLKADLHVFCEKPPGRDLQDIYNVMEIEKQKPGLKLMYGFNHRYHDSIREAKRIIEAGELGQLVDVKGTYGKSKIVSFKSDWRTKRSVAGGGILLDQGIHMLDMMRLFAGEFQDVRSIVSNSFWHHDVEDNAYALMRSEKGVVGFIHSSATQWRHKFHLELTLSEGAIILSGILSGTKSYGAETITVITKGDNNSNGDPREMTLRYNEDNSWRDEIMEFANFIMLDKTVTAGSSYDAFKTMELVYRIYAADKDWSKKYNLCDTVEGEHHGK